MGMAPKELPYCVERLLTGAFHPHTIPSPSMGEGIVCLQEELVIQPPMTSLKRRMASMCWFAPLRPLFLVSTER